MKFFKWIFLPIFLFAPLFAAAQTRELVYGQIGDYTKVGFKAPDVQFGAGLEIPVKSRFEIQLESGYSPTHKAATHDGHEFSSEAGAIFWATHLIGAYGGASFGYLQTSQFEKGLLEIRPGVVVRIPHFEARVYVEYADEIANGIDRHGVETSQEKGVHILFDERLSHGVRLGVVFDMFHALNQGNPACDGTYGTVTCPRSGGVTGDYAFRVTMEFPRHPKREF